jgi:hypothetical protein
MTACRQHTRTLANQRSGLTALGPAVKVGRVEVVGEALDHRGQRAAIGLHEVIAEQHGSAGDAAS